MSAAQKLWVDQDYQGEWSEWLHEHFAIQLEIVSAEPDQIESLYHSVPDDE